MTHICSKLSLFSLLALAMLGCPSEGDSGNLTFADTDGNSWNFNRQITPMATGSTVVFEVADAADADASITVSSVTSSDPGVVSVDGMSGSNVTISGLQAGQSTLDVNTSAGISDTIAVDVVDAADFNVEIASPSWAPLYLSPLSNFAVLRGVEFSVFATPLAPNGTELAGVGAESWTLTLDDETAIVEGTPVEEWSFNSETSGRARVSVGTTSTSVTVHGGGAFELVVPVVEVDAIELIEFSAITPTSAEVGTEFLIAANVRDIGQNYVLCGDSISIAITSGSEFATLETDAEYLNELGGPGDFPGYLFIGTQLGTVELTLTLGDTIVTTSIEVIPAAEPAE